MASLKHAFTSAKGDGTDITLVQPSDWNAEHNLTVSASNVVLGRVSAGAGAIEEVGIGTGATQVAAGNHTHTLAALGVATVGQTGHYADLVTKLGDVSIGSWSTASWGVNAQLPNASALAWQGGGFGHMIGFSADTFYIGRNNTNALDGTGTPTYDLSMGVGGPLFVGGYQVITTGNIGSQSVAFATNAGHATTADSISGGSPGFNVVGSYTLASHASGTFAVGNFYDGSTINPSTQFSGLSGTWECTGAAPTGGVDSLSQPLYMYSFVRTA